MTKPKQKICLTIAGLDPSGGAGVLADIKTFSAFGCYGAGVITSVTFQNTQGVFGAESQSAESVRSQTMPIIDDFEIDALKTGMLPTAAIIRETAAIISDNKLRNVVVDPVVRSTSGYDLISDNALASLSDELFPLADLVTPNLQEAERIAKMKIRNEEDIDSAGKLIRSLGARNVLIKGGHHSEDQLHPRKSRKATDFLFSENGVEVFETEFIDTTATHGTGCVLSASIAANLALGNSLVESIAAAKEFVYEAILGAPNLGSGYSPIGIVKP